MAVRFSVIEPHRFSCKIRVRAPTKTCKFYFPTGKKKKKAQGRPLCMVLCYPGKVQCSQHVALSVILLMQFVLVSEV